MRVCTFGIWCVLVMNNVEGNIFLPQFVVNALESTQQKSPVAFRRSHPFQRGRHVVLFVFVVGIGVKIPCRQDVNDTQWQVFGPCQMLRQEQSPVIDGSNVSLHPIQHAVLVSVEIFRRWDLGFGQNTGPLRQHPRWQFVRWNSALRIVNVGKRHVAAAAGRCGCAYWRACGCCREGDSAEPRGLDMQTTRRYECCRKVGDRDCRK
mmetsp:Transcript_16398/g.37951  ORF Transcript_16398/g.37951 Transcript_16398/m.37951 type:complete len:206 (-) Transcript_16398:307-924(-)